MTDPAPAAAHESATCAAPSPAAWAGGVQWVSVIGAGTMGEGIAQNFAECGVRVRLIDIAEAAVERCRTQIGRNVEQARQAGLAGDDAAAVLSRIDFIASAQPAREVGAAALVVETVPEVVELKRALMAELDGLPADVVIGSNTSSLTIDSFAAGMGTPERVVGLHYFNPAHIVPAVEIHRGERTADSVVEQARALLQRIGKVPFLVRKSVPGFVINRLTGALMREIYHLLDEEVITPEELDLGVKASIGFRMAWMGPMESADFTGLDVGARVVAAILPELSQRTVPSTFLLQKVAAGDLGVKTGRGWLDHGGRSRAELLEERNARLLRQLKSFQDEQAQRDA